MGGWWEGMKGSGGDVEGKALIIGSNEHLHVS